MNLYVQPRPGVLQDSVETLSAAWTEIGKKDPVPPRAAVVLNGDRLARIIHAANVNAGWWTNLATGESLIGKRNVGEMLMLAVTELCEAEEGLDLDSMDDKLPQRKSVEVEIADGMIRVFDTAGSFTSAFGAHVANALDDPKLVGTVDMIWGVRHLGGAMEAWRKSRREEFLDHLGRFVVWSISFGWEYNLDLAGALEEKFWFNATRADHKLESRRGTDGKKV